MKPDPAPRVLVADDQPDVLAALRLLLKGDGFQLTAVRSPAEALAAARDQDFDVALVDLNYARDTTSGEEGIELLGRLLTFDPTLPVVVMTAWGSVELAVEAMRRGARDFVQKPWENERLLSILRNQVALARALRRERRLEAENQMLRGTSPELIAGSPSMRPVLELLERVGPSDANVLILGENGTGKGVIARALHAASRRAPGPMVTVNMGGLSDGLFESELFGHVKGAFTDAKTDRVGRFELAEGGTLFLDEVGNLSLPQQAKLLRVIETGEYERLGSSKTRRADVRLIAATNADLAREVAEGRFRQDLLFRLNTIEIHVPPLRERPEDLVPLGVYFLGRHARQYGKSLDGFEPAALQALRSHSWPGNVRELSHVIERAALMASGPQVTVSDLGLRAAAGSEPRLDDLSLEEVERWLIRKALARFEGNAIKAAEALGLSRSAFYRRLQKHGL